jgi:outer membrane protein TolC
MKQLVLALLSFTLIPVSASTGPRVDIYEFAREALALDSQYQDAVFDKQVSDVRKDAAGNLYRGRFTLEPYIDRYDNETSSYFASTYKEKGLRSAYTQFLPIGTAITFGYSDIWDNTRSTSLAADHKYSIGLVQPLWRNFFGLGERAARDAADLGAEAYESRALASRNEACGRAADTYIDSWTQEKRALFVNEVHSLASDMHRRSEPSMRSGQIGKLDWWGVQSEYLNLQDQKSQAELRVLQQRLAMTRVSPASTGRALSDPAGAFQKMLVNLKSEQKKGPTYQELYYEKAYESQMLKTKSERSFSRPNLDLKLTQYQSEGKAVTAPYEDKNITVSLELIWQLNDSSISAPARIAKIEAERAHFKSKELQRTRQDRFREYVEIEKKRAALLEQITAENKRRFLQGRIDFQDFLRVKEQWFDTQNRMLEKQASYWKNLAAFSLTENFPVPFCPE